MENIFFFHSDKMNSIQKEDSVIQEMFCWVFDCVCETEQTRICQSLTVSNTSDVEHFHTAERKQTCSLEITIPLPHIVPTSFVFVVVQFNNNIAVTCLSGGIWVVTRKENHQKTWSLADSDQFSSLWSLIMMIHRIMLFESFGHQKSSFVYCHTAVNTDLSLKPRQNCSLVPECFHLFLLELNYLT